MSNTIPSVNLTINVGSSGLKFFLYRMRHSATEVDPDGVREAGANWLRFVAHDDHQVAAVERQIELPNYETPGLLPSRITPTGDSSSFI